MGKSLRSKTAKEHRTLLRSKFEKVDNARQAVCLAKLHAIVSRPDLTTDMAAAGLDRPISSHEILGTAAGSSFVSRRPVNQITLVAMPVRTASSASAMPPMMKMISMTAASSSSAAASATGTATGAAIRKVKKAAAASKTATFKSGSKRTSKAVASE